MPNKQTKNKNLISSNLINEIKLTWDLLGSENFQKIIFSTNLINKNSMIFCSEIKFINLLKKERTNFKNNAIPDLMYNIIKEVCIINEINENQIFNKHTNHCKIRRESLILISILCSNYGYTQHNISNALKKSQTMIQRYISSDYTDEIKYKLKKIKEKIELIINTK